MTSPKFLPKTPFPDWANDENYPVGVDPWSGAPNKIEPVIGIRNEGVQPDDQIGAQQYNWLNFRYGAMLRALVHAPMQTWQAFTVATETDEGPGAFYGGITSGFGIQVAAVHTPLGGTMFTPQKPYIMACNPGDGSSLMSGYGYHWSPLPTPTLLSSVRHVFGTASGKVLLADSLNPDVQVLSPLNAWTTKATGMTEGYTHCFHQAGARLLCSFEWGGSRTSPNRLAVSDDDGDTWTLVSIVDAALDIIRFADNGAGIIVAVAIVDGGSNPVIIRSIDNGDNWSLVDVLTFGTGNLGLGLAYSPVWNQFMITSTKIGSVWTSEDGASWIARAGFPSNIEALDNVVLMTSGLACVGSVFAAIVNMKIDPSQLDLSYGVLYTFDLGSHWHWIPLGHLTDVGKPLGNIIALGGQFLIGSVGVVYVSAPLWYPDSDVNVT